MATIIENIVSKENFILLNTTERNDYKSIIFADRNGKIDYASKYVFNNNYQIIEIDGKPIQTY